MAKPMKRNFDSMSQEELITYIGSDANEYISRDELVNMAEEKYLREDQP